MTITERHTGLTAHHDPSFFSNFWCAIPVLISILLMIPAGSAEQNRSEPVIASFEYSGDRFSAVNPSTTNEELMPTPPLRITISGRITTPDGVPIEGATIRTEFFMTYDTRSVSVTSEADGTYRINNAHGFRQNMTIEKPGYLPVSQERVFSQNLNTADFVLTPVARPSPGFTGISGCIGLGSIVLLMVIFRQNQK